MNMWKVVFIAVMTVFFVLCLRSQHKEITALIGMAAVVLIFIITTDRFREAAHVLNDIAKNSAYSDVASVLFKALGVSVLVRVSSDICTEAGEAALASQIDIMGKVEILLLSLPLVLRLLDIVNRFLV